jgi:hypothetical protein
MCADATGRDRAGRRVRATRLPENNTLFKTRVRSFVQFTYIHKSVYGSSAFA